MCFVCCSSTGICSFTHWNLLLLLLDLFPRFVNRRSKLRSLAASGDTCMRSCAVKGMRWFQWRKADASSASRETCMGSCGVKEMRRFQLRKADSFPRWARACLDQWRRGDKDDVSVVGRLVLEIFLGPSNFIGPVA